MTDQPEEVEGEEVEEADESYETRAFGMADGDLYVPDIDLLGEALELLGVVPLSYQSRDGQLYVLIACSAGFKWSSIESIGPERSKPSLRTVQ